MAASARSLAWSVVGALGGAAGLAASRCAGGACRTCLACAAPGAGLVLLALLRRREGGERRGGGSEPRAPAGSGAG